MHATAQEIEILKDAALWLKAYGPLDACGVVDMKGYRVRVARHPAVSGAFEFTITDHVLTGYWTDGSGGTVPVVITPEVATDVGDNIDGVDLAAAMLAAMDMQGR
jgi:hypothetical protein